MTTELTRAVEAPLDAPVRPACWIVEWGAISLPLGDPSRITAMLAHHTKEEAEQALAEVSEEFNAHMWMAGDVDAERKVNAELPKPDVFDPGRFGVAWREEKVRAYAAQEVAAERERCAEILDALSRRLRGTAKQLAGECAMHIARGPSVRDAGWHRAPDDHHELAALPPRL